MLRKTWQQINCRLIQDISDGHSVLSQIAILGRGIAVVEQVDGEQRTPCDSLYTRLPWLDYLESLDRDEMSLIEGSDLVAVLQSGSRHNQVVSTDPLSSRL